MAIFSPYKDTNIITKQNTAGLEWKNSKPDCILFCKYIYILNLAPSNVVATKAYINDEHNKQWLDSDQLSWSRFKSTAQ